MSLVERSHGLYPGTIYDCFDDLNTAQAEYLVTQFTSNFLLVFVHEEVESGRWPWFLGMMIEKIAALYIPARSVLERERPGMRHRAGKPIVPVVYNFELHESRLKNVIISSLWQREWDLRERSGDLSGFWIWIWCGADRIPSDALIRNIDRIRAEDPNFVFWGPQKCRAAMMQWHAGDFIWREEAYRHLLLHTSMPPADHYCSSIKVMLKDPSKTDRDYLRKDHEFSGRFRTQLKRKHGVPSDAAKLFVLALRGQPTQGPMSKFIRVFRALPAELKVLLVTTYSGFIELWLPDSDLLLADTWVAFFDRGWALPCPVCVF